MDSLFARPLEEIGLRLALAAGALVIIFALPRLIARLIGPLLQRIAAREAQNGEGDLLDALTTPIRLVMIALGLYVAAALLLPKGVPEFVQQLSRTLIIISLFSLLYKMVGRFTRSTRLLAGLTGLRIDEQLLPFLRTGIQIVLVALAIVIVLQEWKYDVNGLIAGLGLSGLAFALAAEDTVANLFGFTTIVGDRPLTVGEYIATPDVSGTVERVGFRSTRIRQPDQAVVTIPNSKLASSVITNWSRLSKRRLDFTLGLDYGPTSAQMRALLDRLETLLRSRERVEATSIQVLFTGFKENSLDVRLICFIRHKDWLDFMREQQEIMLQIMDIVAALGLDYANPNRPLIVEQARLAPPAAPPEAESQ